MIDKTHKEFEASKSRLFQFIEKYYNVITLYLDKQIKEEDANGKSNSQYNYIILRYAHKYANIASYLCKMQSYDKVYSDLKIEQLTSVLAKQGINFNEILQIYNMPKKALDDKEVLYSQIGTTPINDVEERVITTSASDKIDDVVISIPDPFVAYTCVTDEEDIVTVDDLSQFNSFDCYGMEASITLDFQDFNSKHPVIVIPADVEIIQIRESSTYHDLTEGFVKTDVQVQIADILCDVYIYYLPTLSDINNQLILQLDYTRL